MLITIISSLSLISILLTFLIIEIKKKKSQNWKSAFQQKSSYIDNLYRQIESLSKNNKEWYKRVKELEDIKGDAFQVKLRNEIIEVKADFTKLEIVIMLSGVTLLLERTSNPDDAQIYISLIKKINEFINDMKEGD